MAGVRRDALRTGRIVEVAERTYRVRVVDVFDRLGCDRQTAAVGRRWVALFHRGRQLPGLRAADLEGGSRGTGDGGDDDEAGVAVRTILRRLRWHHKGQAIDLAEYDGRGMARAQVVALVRAIDRAWP